MKILRQFKPEHYGSIGPVYLAIMVAGLVGMHITQSSGGRRKD